MFRLHRPGTIILAILAASTAAAQGGPPYHSWPADVAPTELQDEIADARLIVAEMHGTLLRELTRAIASGGPERAIRSCHVDVAGVVRRIGRRDGVSAGRTSIRLRNSFNAPPAWAAPIVSAHAGGPAARVPTMAVDLGRSVGVMQPIAEQRICASCHGPGDRVPPAVRRVLEARYPQDVATGFREGDLRGWYWVEVPKRSR